MSIANLIVQPEAAYLITDSGSFEEDGTIFALRPKVLPALGDLFAYASVGNCARLTHHVARKMSTVVVPRRSLDPECFMALVREAYKTLGADPTIHWSRWVAAGWSREHNRPVGLALFTSAQDAAETGDRAWTWREFHSLLQPHITDEELGSLGYSRRDLLDPSRFRPEVDGSALVDLVRQRRTGWGADGSKSGCFVAGKVTLTKVTPHGVETSVLHEYPDFVGELAGAPHLV